MAVRRVRNPSRRRRAARRPNPIRRHRRRNPATATPIVHRRRRRRNPSRLRRVRHAVARRRNPDYNALMEHIAPFAEVGLGMVGGIAANRLIPIQSRRGLKLRGLLHMAGAVAIAAVARNRHVTNMAAGFAGAGVLDLFRQNVPSVARYLQADAVETVLGIEEGTGRTDTPLEADQLGTDSIGFDGLGADSLGYETMSGENDLD